MRFAIVVLVLLASGAVQASERTYTCGDANGEVSVIFEYDSALPEPFLRIDMQLEDYGLSTMPGERSHDGEFVSAHYSGDDFIGADVMSRHVDNTLPVLSLRIVTVYQQPRELITGGVAVSGGGVWTITCSVS